MYVLDTNVISELRKKPHLQDARVSGVGDVEVSGTIHGDAFGRGQSCARYIRNRLDAGVESHGGRSAYAGKRRRDQGVPRRVIKIERSHPYAWGRWRKNYRKRACAAARHSPCAGVS